MRLNVSRDWSVLAVVLLTVATSIFHPTHAAVRPEEPEELGSIGEGTLVANLPSGEQSVMPLAKTSIRASIAASAATVEVDQSFRNSSAETIEALYLFPLPAGAAVVDMRMRIGDRTIASEIKTRDEARAAYAMAVSSGRQAALVEQRARNLYTTKVANVRPGDAIDVHLRYVQSLEYDAGEYRFEVPLVVRESAKKKAERSGDAEAKPRAKRSATTPRYLPEGVRSGTNVSISVDVDAGVPIADVGSASHQNSIARPEPNRASVRLARRDEIPNRDFSLRIRVAGDEAQASCLASEAPDGGAYFAIDAVPPADAFSSGVLKKEIVFVVDTSGSMEGASIEEAKNALLSLVHGLNHGDAFDVVRFSDDFTSFRPHPVVFNQQNVDAADAYVSSLEADGGTTATPAIREALTMARSGDRLRIVAFLTDGQLGDTEELIEMLEQNLGASRLFTFGIGSAPDDFLSRKMAEMGRGTSRFARPGGEMAAIADFQNEVAAPVLTDVRVTLEGANVVDTTPERIPDLYASHPLVVRGKADRMPAGNAIVEARGPRGPVRFTVPIRAKSGKAGEAVGALYAKSRVGALLDKLHEAPGDASIRDEIVSLGLEHRLVTPFTAFVAVDSQPVVPEGTKAKKVKVPTARPEKPKEPVDAGDGSLGALTLRIVDPSGAVVAGAAVELATGQRGISNGDGAVTFTDLPPGEYALEAESPGFRMTAVEGIAVASGKETALDVALDVGGAGETVTVTTHEEVQTEIGAEAQTVTYDRIQSLPLNGRSSLGLASIAPGTVAPGAGNSATDRNFSVDGASSVEAVEVLDGVEVTRTEDGALANGGVGYGSGSGSGAGAGRAMARQLAVVGRNPAPPARGVSGRRPLATDRRVDTGAPTIVQGVDLFALLRTQRVDGSWGDPASEDERLRQTAEAVVAFLQGGHTDRAGGYRAQVRRALDFLAVRVTSDGRLVGATSDAARAAVHRALELAAKMTSDARYATAATRLARMATLGRPAAP
jgi:Ca-activated chloride channel family protein